MINVKKCRAIEKWHRCQGSGRKRQRYRKSGVQKGIQERTGGGHQQSAAQEAGGGAPKRSQKRKKREVGDDAKSVCVSTKAMKMVEGCALDEGLNGMPKGVGGGWWVVGGCFFEQ